MTLMLLLSLFGCNGCGNKIIDQDNDGYAADIDCNDHSETIHPAAEEICDYIDNDCDGLIDDEDDVGPSAHGKVFLDFDEDGFGDIKTVVGYCETPPELDGYIGEGGDCNDQDASINPLAQEVCDEVDNDCDELIDDLDPSLDQDTTVSFYLDEDGDGFGDPSNSVSGCALPEGARDNSDDCNDDNPDINPSVEEDCDDGIDNDCDYDIDGFDANCIANNPLQITLSLVGTQERSEAGYAVEAAGDVNYDLWDDMLIGAPGTSYETGEAYLIMSSPVLHSGSLYDATHVFRGAQTGSRAGNAVAGLGDTDNDSRGDILIAAEHTNLHDSGIPDGAVHLFSGLHIVAWKPRGLDEATIIINGREGERLGRSVSGVGDINGDGLNDYLVSAPGSSAHDTDNHGVYVFYGGRDYSSSLDAPHQIMVGRTSSERHELTEVGDVNGDGVADILIGASTLRGDAHLLWGGELPAGVITDDEVDVSFVPERGNDKAFQVAGLGDMNRDQKMDIMIGAPFADNRGTDSGSAYIFLGSDIPNSGTLFLNDARYTFHGDSPHDRAGYIHNAGDLNTDLENELLIGAPGFSKHHNNQGKIYTILLDLVTLSSSQNIDNIATHTLEGSFAQDRFGRKMAVVGDVDRSGQPDILVGIPDRDDYRDEMGGALFVSLSTEECEDCDEVCDDGMDNDHDSFSDCLDSECSDFPSCNIQPEDCEDGLDNDGDGGIDCIDPDCDRYPGCPVSTGAYLLGEDDHDRAGFKMKDIGDIDGDGLHDLMISAPNNSDLAGNHGKIYVMKGSTLLTTQTISLEQADLRFMGEGAGDLTGWDISSAGDIDGDGLGDVMFSAPRSNHNGENSGKVWVFLGSSIANMYQVPIGTADYIFVGDNEEEYLGTGLAGNFDINGNGNDDIIVSGLKRNEWGQPIAVGYIIPLGLIPPGQYNISDISYRFDSDPMSEDEHLQFVHVTSLEDLDGDGYDDVAMSARGVSYPYFECGGAYIMYSSSLSITNREADIFIHGDEADAKMGFIHSAGDIDQDGIGDLLLGQDNGTIRKSFIHNGNRLGIGSQSVANTNYSFEASGQHFYYIHDVDGDDRNDYIFHDNYNIYIVSGSVFSHYGYVDFPWEDSAYIFQNKGGEYGRMGVLRDIDGDGFDEIFLSNIFQNDEQGAVTWYKY